MVVVVAGRFAIGERREAIVGANDQRRTVWSYGGIHGVELFHSEEVDDQDVAACVALFHEIPCRAGWYFARCTGRGGRWRRRFFHSVSVASFAYPLRLTSPEALKLTGGGECGRRQRNTIFLAPLDQAGSGSRRGHSHSLSSR